MLSSKKLKPYIILGGILISLIFNFAFWAFNYALAQGLALPDPTGTGLAEGSLADTILAIINAALAFAGVIALIVIIYGGYVWMTSGGIPQRIVLAKKILLSAVVGFIIILTSWAIVNFIINGMNGGPGGGGPGPGGPGPLLGASSFVRKWVDPYNGQTNVPLCRIVQAGFSDNLSPGTVNSTNVIIKEYCAIINDCDLHDDGVINISDSCQGDNYCGYNITTSGIFNVTGKTFEYLPNKEWFENTQYRIEFTANIQNLSLSEFLVPATSIFTTGNTTDNTPPQVLPNISPANGDTDVCLVKPVTVQFSEPMRVSSLKDALTLNSNDPDFASLEIDPISPAGLAFDASTPSSNTAVYYPTILYSTNQLYNPVLRAGEDTNGNKALDVGEDLNADTKLDAIQDACLNSLDGNADGTAQGSPIDDHGDSPSDITIDPPGDNPAIANYSFTTGTTEECIPEITGITPAAYYDPANAGEQITITGKNFGTIPTEVLLASNVFVNGNTNSCLDNAAIPPNTNTYTNPADFCIKSWNDGQITLIPPARDGSSNGAIDGPVQVKLGGFAACTGTCAAGRNKDKVCATADPDCPIGDSNINFSIDIQSPHISSQSRKQGPKGQAITLAGTDFGDGDNDAGDDDSDDDAVDGIVRFIRQGDRAVVNGIFPCGASSWLVNRIIAEFPIDTGAVIVNIGDVFDVQVERTDGRNSNFGTFAITAGTPGPVMCAIAPDCGPTGTSVTIDGKRFGTAGTVSFGSAAAATGFWADTQIFATSPTQPTDGTYPVEVTAGGEPSNTLPFSTICSGRPKVVESLTCNNATQSPSPYKNDTVNPDTDNDACINTSAISARFNMDMASGDNIDPNWDNSIRKPSNVGVLKCNTGPVFDNLQCSSAITDDDGILELINADTNSEGFIFRPAIGWAVADTWYKVTIAANVQSQLGTAMGSEYIWKFHIAASAAACPVDTLSVNPANRTVAVGTPVNYTAVPQSANCNFIGACADYVYNWSTSGTPIPHSSIPIPSNTCAASVSADSITPVGDPDDIMANIPAEGVSSIAQLTITAGGGPGAAVCGNGKIEAGEQCDDKNTFANDGCSATCQRETPAIFSVKPTNLAANVCKNAAVEITFTGLMNFSTLTPSTIRLLQGVAPVAGSIQARYIDSDSNGAMDQTLATIFPSSVFADTTNYSVEVLGGPGGVKSKYGAELDLTSCGVAMNWSIDHCASSFETGTEICKIDKVSIILEKDFNPDPSINDINSYYGPDLFTCAGKNDCPDDFDPLAQNQHNAIAEAKDATGLTLGGIAYSWTKSTDAPFTLVDPDANDEDLMVQADPKSGIGALTVKADGGLAGIKTASTNVTVAPCDNPWQPTGTYPYKDDLASSPANPTNFSLWYCRDAGGPGTADDLPDLSIIKRDIPAGELIREFFFYDAANPNDALGLRVYTNLNHWPAKEWYDKRAPNKLGAPASTTVDGWEGIQAGRTIYVNAANHTGVAPPLMNIYLMSHSDKISTNLRNIYNQLKSNWKFAITEYDDGTDGTTLNPPADRGHLRKLQRDTRRITDLYGAAVDLYQSKISKGKYPLMPSGSYISGNSTSVWPSWDGALSKEVGAPMPHDPISQMSSLIGWWKLNEGVGIATANDGLTGFGGVLSGGLDATGWRSGTACKYGNCLELNGTSNYIDAGDFSGLYSNKLTVSAWIKTKPNAGWDDIVAGGYGNFVFAISDGNLTIGDQGGKTGTGPNIDPIESKRQIDDDKWHFVAATYDGLVVKLYIDGVFEVSGPVNGDFDTAGGNLYIGSTPVNGSEYFDGSIDEVRIWNTPLGDAEINNLFKSNAAKFGSSEDSGWDQTKNAFSCVAGADYDTHIYHYQQESGGANFSLYAALEWVGGDGSTWRKNTIDPCDGDPLNKIGSSDCPCYNYRQQEVDAANLGLCKNNQWDSSLGEMCDSTGLPLTGLESRICSAGKCSGGTNDGGDCAFASQCPGGGTCVPGTPSCDDNCKPFCPGGSVANPVCGNGIIESPVENCECSVKKCFGGPNDGLPCTDNTSCDPGGSCNFDPASCTLAGGGQLSDYYCYDKGPSGEDDLDTSSTNVIDDVFSGNAVTCAPPGSGNECNMTCLIGTGNPVYPEVGNLFYEPWVTGEQCEPKRGYCSGNGAACTDDPSCGGFGSCIALGNGKYYCDDGTPVKCGIDGTRFCATGTLTTCIGEAATSGTCSVSGTPCQINSDCPLFQTCNPWNSAIPINEWQACGGDYFPAKPFNYLQTDLWGWCFR